MDGLSRTNHFSDILGIEETENCYLQASSTQLLWKHATLQRLQHTLKAHPCLGALDPASLLSGMLSPQPQYPLGSLPPL